MDSTDAHIDAVEHIRREMTRLGAERGNPLVRMLHEASVRFSSQVQEMSFIPELLQNADQNMYDTAIIPSVDIVLTLEDITGVGASSTLVLFTNDIGLNSSDIEALCGLDTSIKSPYRLRCIDRGIGLFLRSVFGTTHRPYVLSNGYRIRFTDQANLEAGIGCIVPEWVEVPSITDLRRIYGEEELTRSMVVFPLRTEEVKEVRKQLNEITPEILLFMSRVRQITIRDEEQKVYIRRWDVKIASGTNDELRAANLLTQKSPSSMSEEFSYYLVEHKLPVTSEVDLRTGIEDQVVTLAFPSAERLRSRDDMIHTYFRSYFQFIVIARFPPFYSYDTALKIDGPWNTKIFPHIPSTFASALEFFIQKTCPSTLINIYGSYIPIHAPRVPKLEEIQRSILDKLRDKDIILVDSRLGFKRKSPKFEFTSAGCHLFCKPEMARFVDPTFREILEAALNEDKVNPALNVDDLPWFIVDVSLQNCHSEVLQALGVPEMTDGEYADCLGQGQWLTSLTEDLYWRVVYFVLRKYLNSCPHLGIIDTIPIFKYTDSIQHGYVPCSLASIREVTAGMQICFWEEDNDRFAKFSSVVKAAVPLKFMPASTLTAFKVFQSSKEQVIENFWIASNIINLTIGGYVKYLWGILPTIRDRTFITSAVELIYQCMRGRHVDSHDLFSGPARSLPFVDECGRVQNKTADSVLLLPAFGSTWPTLKQGSWRPVSMFVMSDDYILPKSDWNLNERHILSRQTDPEEVKVFRSFLQDVYGAVDLSQIDHIPDSWQLLGA